MPRPALLQQRGSQCGGAGRGVLKQRTVRFYRLQLLHQSHGSPPWNGAMCCRGAAHKHEHAAAHGGKCHSIVVIRLAWWSCHHSCHLVVME